MKKQSVAGINSILLGLISMLVIGISQHYESFRGAGSSYLLNAADRLGLVRQVPLKTEMEMRSPGLLSFTDETAMKTAIGYGVYLALSSLLLALWAEHHNEENLYLSAGFICGSSGLFLANRGVGLFAMVVGTVAILVLRRVRRA